MDPPLIRGLDGCRIGPFGRQCHSNRYSRCGFPAGFSIAVFHYGSCKTWMMSADPAAVEPSSHGPGMVGRFGELRAGQNVSQQGTVADYALGPEAE